MCTRWTKEDVPQRKHQDSPSLNSHLLGFKGWGDGVELPLETWVYEDDYMGESDSCYNRYEISVLLKAEIWRFPLPYCYAQSHGWQEPVYTTNYVRLAIPCTHSTLHFLPIASYLIAYWMSWAKPSPPKKTQSTKPIKATEKGPATSITWTILNRLHSKRWDNPSTR